MRKMGRPIPAQAAHGKPTPQVHISQCPKVHHHQKVVIRYESHSDQVILDDGTIICQLQRASDLSTTKGPLLVSLAELHNQSLSNHIWISQTIALNRREHAMIHLHGAEPAGFRSKRSYRALDTTATHIFLSTKCPASIVLRILASHPLVS
ncbi:hypothetical protein CIHG_06549 [Coccidioides immitis H538.4]|uniref:Uncharacterized protein n=3 Tax=Coccidioides immitis TaxID=5501 RepID=A0A0J8QMM0_COCIT|nr:hypothetical protein CIRG_07962 [Coccidioides immitis RMSCC 2394]KMU72458.1 hypothetical protein CISG_03106 [Coccidioides immitis RMSCC 3703]KMU88611.1 hypothetical protein CIHG_06549 [Coccidioides immitis H538.4]